MQQLSQLSEELLGDLQNWGFNLCSRSTARMCHSFFKFTIPTNSYKFLQIPTIPTNSYKFTIPTNLKLWNRLGEKKQASSQFSRLLILVWRKILQMHNSREFRNLLEEENHISVRFCFFSSEYCSYDSFPRKKQYGRNVFFEERNQNVCPQCSSVTVSAQWCFARSQLSNMWSYNISYLHT